MDEKNLQFLISHGYSRGGISKYIFESEFDSEGYYNINVGIVHLLSSITSSWTLAHETNGHNQLLITNMFCFHLGTIKHELFLKLFSLCKEENCKISIPVKKDNLTLKDIRIEGLLTAIMKLDRYISLQNKNSIITHEGYSDKIADYYLNVDSRPLIESAVNNNPNLNCHLTGMKLAEDIVEKFGSPFLIWAASVSLNTGITNPLDEDFNFITYFKNETNLPDQRFKKIAESSNIPKCFPTEYQKYSEDFLTYTKEVFPNITDYVYSMPGIMKDDSVLLQNIKQLQRTYLEIIYSVPYLSLDPAFVHLVYKKIWQDSDVFAGSISRLESIRKYRKGMDFMRGWTNWEHYLGPVEELHNNFESVSRVLSENIYASMGLMGEFFFRNPPIIIQDGGNCEVELIIRPDITKNDSIRFLYKDFIESLSDALFGRVHSERIIIPCYMGAENITDCRPEELCYAKKILEIFESAKSFFLICRPYNKTIEF